MIPWLNCRSEAVAAAFEAPLTKAGLHVERHARPDGTVTLRFRDEDFRAAKWLFSDIAMADRSLDASWACGCGVEMPACEPACLKCGGL